MIALESNKYGWFWECPNGGDKCHYRHALPPGFVLNKDKKKEDKKDDITIEELVEIERAKLGADLTKITLESFIAWKKKKLKEKQEKEQKESDRKRAEYKAGKNIGLSGREMFTFNPDLAVDIMMDEDEATFDITQEENEDEGVYREINFDTLVEEEADGSGTQVSKREFFGGTNNDKTIVAAGGREETDVVDSSPIDETLFAEDEDLDALEDELCKLNVD